MASLQEVLAQIPGLAGYQAQVNANQQQGMNTLQMAQGAGSLMSLVQQQEARRQAAQREAEMRARLAAGEDPEKVAVQYAPAGQILTTLTASKDRAATLEATNANRQLQMEQARALQTERLAQQAELEREHRAQQAELARQRSEDMRLTNAERNQARMDMIRLAASLRQPPQPQPPVAIIGTDGKPVYVNRADAIGKSPAVRETADRVIPANIAKAYAENSTALRKIDSALSEVDKYPSAFGLQNMRGDALSQRMDPKGVTARAIIADIGSLKIHDRSGAAVTAAETPRLLPFIPNVNDRPEAIRKKLALFRKEYQAIQNDIGSMYSPEQGYRALPSPQTRASDNQQQTSGQPGTGRVIDFNALPK